jgi:hypothetical protein
MLLLPRLLPQQKATVASLVAVAVALSVIAVLLAIAVLLVAVAVALSVIADRLAVMVALAHRATVALAHRATVALAVAVIVVANTWVDLLECLNTYRAWSPDKTPLAVIQQDQTTHTARLNLANMSSRNQQYRSMEEGCSI